jgi:O-antigen/teichoic acid export membrane protein
MSKILILNSSSNIALLVLRLGVAFVLTPVIVHALGNYDYGINEIVLAYIGYMGLLEIGIQPAVTRFVARYSANGTKDDLQHVFSSAIFFSTLVGLSVALLLVGWAWTGARGLVPENGDATRYVSFLLIVSCQVLVSFPGNVVQCIHQGHQRYGLTNLVTAVNTVIGTTIIYFFLKQGYGLRTLTLGNAIGIAIKFSILGWLLRWQRFGEYRFRFSDIDWQSLRELYGFGVKSFLLGISSTFSKKASPLVIGTILGPASVVFYMIPYNLIGHLNNIVSAATLNFMPYFSKLHARGDMQKTREVFLSSSRYLVGLSMCGFVSAAFLGSSFLRVWMGTEYARGGMMVLCFIAVWAGFRNLNPFHGRILTGMDLHGILAKIRTVEAVLFLIFSLILVHVLGVEGVALSVLMAALVVEPLILRLVCRQIDWSVPQYLRQVVWPSILPAGILAGYYWWVLAEFTLGGYGSLAIAGGIGCLVYFSLFLVTGVNSDERRYGMIEFKKIIGFVPKPQQNRP